MKNIKRVLAIFCLVILLIPTVIFATGSYSNDNIMVIDETVAVNGTANGLIMLCGNTISSNANGDYGFIAGREVNVSGNITRDAFIVGETVTIEQTGVINRDLYVCASKVIINGAVNRNIYVASSEVLVGDKAYIRGDIHSTTSKLVINETANVLGTVEYKSTTNVSIPEGIKTNVIAVEAKDKTNKTNTIDVQGELFGLLTIFITFVLLLLLAPGFFRKCDNNYSRNAKKMFASFGIGLLVLVFLPIVSIVLMITIVGAPFAFVLLLLYIIAFIIAGVVGSYVTVRTIVGENMNKFLTGVIGVVAYKLLMLVPELSIFVYLFFVSLTLGALLMSFRCCKKQKCLKKDETKEEVIEVKAEQMVEEKKEEVNNNTTETLETTIQNKEKNREDDKNNIKKTEDDN